MDKLSRTELQNLKDRFVANLGLPYTKIRNSLYFIGGKRVNIKITTPRASGRYWFNFQTEADSYIWLCYNPSFGDIEACYWIPNDQMHRMVDIASYEDRYWAKRGRVIPNFEIDSKSDSYIVRDYSEPILHFKTPRIL
jgi:hypothetical protein